MRAGLLRFGLSGRVQPCRVRVCFFIFFAFSINSVTRGLACLDSLLRVRDVPIGNRFGEPDDLGSVAASHSCTQSNPFNATWWVGGGASRSSILSGSWETRGEEKKKSRLIRFIVTFYIFGYKRPVIGEAGCVLNIDLFCRPGDWESERAREPGAVKRGRKTTYQKSSDEEITRFEWAALRVEAFRS